MKQESPRFSYGECQQAPHSQYIVAKKATIDKYFMFIQRAIELLNPKGLLGYIVPHKFFLTKGGKELRKFITEKYQISKIIHFGVTQVFPERSTYTAILILQASEMDQFEFKKVDKISTEALSLQEDIQSYKTEKYNSAPWIFLSPKTEAIFEKFTGEKFERLGDMTDITVGIQTSADDIYIFVPKEETDDLFKFTRSGEDYEIEKSICRSTIYDLSFSAFESIQGNAQMIFPYRLENKKAKIICEDDLEENYPLAWKYLNKFRIQLEKRSVQGNEPKWYQFGRSQSLAKFHDADKLIWPVLATRHPYVLDTENLLFTGGGNGPYYGLLNKSNYSLLYFLGILSHPVIEGMIKARASEFRGSYYSHGKQFIEKLPIKKIDNSNKDEMEKYNTIIDRVRNLISTNVQLKAERNGSRRKIYERKLDTLFNQLVEVINSLYQINEEELITVMSDEMLSISTGENYNGSIE